MKLRNDKWQVTSGRNRHAKAHKNLVIRQSSFVTLQSAFSLLEVMIAVGIFFLGVFAILGVISSGLENARRLQRPIVDAGVLASDLCPTNQLVEGTWNGNLGDLLGHDYDGYSYTETITEVMTNKLFQADFSLQLSGNGQTVSQASVLLWRPQSPAGTLDGATK